MHNLWHCRCQENSAAPLAADEPGLSRPLSVGEMKRLLKPLRKGNAHLEFIYGGGGSINGSHKKELRQKTEEKLAAEGGEVCPPLHSLHALTATNAEAPREMACSQ